MYKRQLDSGTLPSDVKLYFTARAQAWRYEDGEVTIRVGTAEQRAHVWADGRGEFSSLRVRYADWDTPGYGVDDLPPRLAISAPVDESTDERLDDMRELTIELTADRGGLIVYEITLHGLDAELEESTESADQAEPGESMNTGDDSSVELD